MIQDYQLSEFSHDGISRPVYRRTSSLSASPCISSNGNDDPLNVTSTPSHFRDQSPRRRSRIGIGLTPEAGVDATRKRGDAHSGQTQTAGEWRSSLGVVALRLSG